mmetsp:Transcript_12280/g.28398  ORF Transcript_12280/g.28398 Transcript_12280/m.28398 type:complete len:212 (+) Transcript_12280:193-828(+)
MHSVFLLCQRLPQLFASFRTEAYPIAVTLHATIVFLDSYQRVRHDLRWGTKECFRVKISLRQCSDHGLVIVHFGIYIRRQRVVFDDVFRRDAANAQNDGGKDTGAVLSGGAVKGDGMAIALGNQVEDVFDSRGSKSKKQIVDHDQSSRVDLCDEGFLQRVPYTFTKKGSRSLDDGLGNVALSNLSNGPTNVLELVHQGHEMPFFSVARLGK